jgi:hypothetical protein
MKSKDMCSGCENNFYNGKNNLGIKECWSYKSVRIVKRKLVHYNQVPLWTQEPIKTLSCKRIKGYVLIDPKLTC